MTDVFDEALTIGHAGISAGIERRLALFAISMLDCGWQGLDISGADIQEEALRLGLIEKTTFDPERHSQDEGYTLEAGDDYYVPVADLRGILDGTRSASAVAAREPIQEEK